MFRSHAFDLNRDVLELVREEEPDEIGNFGFNSS